MGLYIRKSISFGPLRFNLSKSGVGLSVGVKGLRMGTGPSGNYVHMGRGGIYYRAPLPDLSSHSSSSNLASQTSTRLEIESGSVLQMRSTDSNQLLDELNERLGMALWWPLVLVGGGSALFLMHQLQASSLSRYATALVLLGILAWAIWHDHRRKRLSLCYELGPEIAEAYRRLQEAFRRMSSCSQIWHVAAEYHQPAPLARVSGPPL